MSADFSRIRHFEPAEFARPECLRQEMLDKLDRLRQACGFPLVITSSYRDFTHNTAVGGAADSAHCPGPDGLYSGVDIATHNLGGAGLFMLVKHALAIGYNRIGLYPRHIHLDVEDRLPQQVMWVGSD